MRFSLFVLALIFHFGCMNQPTIGLKPQKFNVYPNKIIWIQLAGLDDEHIAQLSLKDGSLRKTSFDDFRCMGMHWEFNLAKLYPTSNEVMLSMLTGSANIVGSCDDYALKPFWNFYSKKDEVRTVVVEKMALGINSILEAKKCLKADLNWQPDFLVKLDNDHEKETSHQKFNILQKQFMTQKGVYYDSSCQLNKCKTPLSSTLNYLAEELIQYQKRYVLVVRDFSAEHFFATKDALGWQAWWNEWDKVITYMQQTLLTDDTLILVSSVSPIPLQFPQEGEDMKKWLLQGKGVAVRPRALFGKTWAMGAKSENFCGIYKTENLVSRIFWKNVERLPFSL